MQIKLKEEFQTKWEKYFSGADLPMTFYFSDGNNGVEQASETKGWSCLVCDLAKVRKGNSHCFNADSVLCPGGKRYTGYTDQMYPNFKHFLSSGIPGELEGERYIRTPDMVQEIMENYKVLPAKGKDLIFKRWDDLTEQDDPEVVIFFAKPDVLSGLFTLANFDQTDPNGTFTPFGAGCASIVHYPYLEKDTERPRAVIGMFDPSARSCVPADIMTFAAPMTKFEKMVEYMDESFLITNTWDKVRKRISKSH